MASLPVEEKLEFLLHVLATAHEFKPNYAAVAERLAINTTANAQRRFKGIVEGDKKFMLESKKDGTKVVENDKAGHGDTSATKTTTKTPKSRKRSKKEDEDSEAEPTPTKKPRKKASAKKAEKEVEEQDEVSDEEKAKSDDE